MKQTIMKEYVEFETMEEMSRKCGSVTTRYIQHVYYNPGKYEYSMTYGPKCYEGKTVWFVDFEAWKRITSEETA